MAEDTDRNAAGRFVPGNVTAARGGKARATALTPEQRREIALAGLQALADKLFEGDVRAAQRYITERAAQAHREAAERRRAAQRGGE